MPILLALFFSLTASIAQAHILTGNEYLEWADRRYEDRVYIVGYTGGVADTLAITGALCLPEGVTNKQLVDTVVKYLNENPQRRHEDSLLAVLSALLGPWRCAPK